MRFQMRDCPIDRADPFKAEIAVTRRDRDPRDRGGCDARCVDIELLLADPIERSTIALHDVRSDHVAVERIRSAPVAHRDDDVIEPHAI